MNSAPKPSPTIPTRTFLSLLIELSSAAERRHLSHDSGGRLSEKGRTSSSSRTRCNICSAKGCGDDTSRLPGQNRVVVGGGRDGARARLSVVAGAVAACGATDRRRAPGGGSGSPDQSAVRRE